MLIVRVVAISISLLIGGWMLVDGVRAMTTGDYFTPRDGPGKGQLGPWSYVVSAIGLNPRGGPVKTIHVLLGAAWLLTIPAVMFKWSLCRHLLVGCSVCTLWYLPIGTVLGVIELVLVMLPQTRDAFR